MTGLISPTEKCSATFAPPSLQLRVLFVNAVPHLHHPVCSAGSLRYLSDLVYWRVCIIKQQFEKRQTGWVGKSPAVQTRIHGACRPAVLI